MRLFQSKIRIFICILFWVFSVRSETLNKLRQFQAIHQDDIINFKGKSIIYLDLVYSPSLYSFNYGRFFIHKNDVKLVWHGGLSYLPSYIIFPLGINCLLGKSRSNFEIGYCIKPALIKFSSLTYGGLGSNRYYYNDEIHTSFSLGQILNFGYKLLPQKEKGFFIGANLLLYLPDFYAYRTSERPNFIESGNLISPTINFQFGYLF